MDKKVQIRLGLLIFAAATFANADDELSFIINFLVLVIAYTWYMVGVFKESDNV